MVLSQLGCPLPAGNVQFNAPPPQLSLIGFLGAKVFMAITIKGAAVFSFSSSQCGFTVWVGTSCLYSLCVCVIDILIQPFKKQFRLNMLYLIFANVLLNIFYSDYFSRALRCKWTSVEPFCCFSIKEPSYASFNVKHDVDRKKKLHLWLHVIGANSDQNRSISSDIETLGLLP